MDAPPANSGPTLTSWGAARAVTGSMHLLEAGGDQILLDCGLLLERGPEARQRNRVFPFDPYRVHSVVLSHAHVDHCGNLPNLVKQGFGGPIYCTPPTRDLIELMLTDSAKIQHEEALHANILRTRDEAWVEPLYRREDVERTIDQCVAVAFNEPTSITPNVSLRLTDAGHILGSASATLRVMWGSRESTLLFSGDVGRPGMPLLCNPAPLPEADVILCESTYGGHKHEPVAVLAESLRVLLKQTVARGGKLLVPAFSLGRSQLVVHFLQEMMTRGEAPAVPIFVDSPLAMRVADVYRVHPDYLSPETVRQLSEPSNFLGGPLIHYMGTTEESRVLNHHRDPCVIVASGGMVEGGRILHHLKHHVDDPRCTIVLVSYQAPDSVGARLLERKPTVRFLGREWNKWADVVALKGFSGHAGQDEMLAHLRPLAGRARKVRLVHGEPASADALAETLRGAGFADVAPAERGEPMPLFA